MVRVRHHGKRVRGRLLDLGCLADSQRGFSRVGIVVPLHGRSAVDRNRVKRRLREIVRLSDIGRRTSVHADILVNARRDAYASSFDGLRAELMMLAQRMGL